MSKNGDWQLSPAYDVTYSHTPHGKWTSQHQMSINGKRDHFTLEDLLAVGDAADINNSTELIQEVHQAISRWPEFSVEAGLSSKLTDEIAQSHRLNIIS